MNSAAIDVLQLQKRIDRSPFNAWLGLKIVSASAEQTEFKLEARPEFISTPERQVIHGGVLSTLVDAAACYAVIAAAGSLCATVDLRVDFHAPARVGRLRAIGSPLRIGKSVCSAESKIFDDEGKLVASGRGVFMPLGLPA